MKSNKRTYIRITERLSVEVENDSGELIHGVTLDVSNQGIGIRCSTSDRDRITPQGDFVDQGHPIKVQVYLSIPNALRRREFIHVRCGIVYSRRLAQDLCQIGMYFLDMDASTAARLNQFIQNRKQADKSDK